MAWLGNGTMVFVYGGSSYMETYGLHTDYMTLTTVVTWEPWEPRWDTWGAWQISPPDLGYAAWYIIDYIYVQEPNYIMFRYHVNHDMVWVIVENRSTITTPEGPAEGGTFHSWNTYEEAWDYYQSANPENYYNLIQGASQINGIKSIII